MGTSFSQLYAEIFMNVLEISCMLPHLLIADLLLIFFYRSF